MPSPAALMPRRNAAPMGVPCVVSKAPASIDGLLSVTWTALDGDQVEEGPLYWSARGAALPAVGDDALLYVDAQGGPWAMAWPTASGASASPAEIAALDARLDTIEAPPRARVYSTVNVSVPNNDATAVLTFDAERYDSAALHSGAAPSRLTAPVAGLYEISAQAQWAANATGRRQLALRVNGALLIEVAESSSAKSGTIAEYTKVGPTEYELAVGDYVEVRAFQTSGGALNVSAVGNYTPEFIMRRVSA